jgi:hypothetical protein
MPQSEDWCALAYARNKPESEGFGAGGGGCRGTAEHDSLEIYLVVL